MKDNASFPLNDPWLAPHMPVIEARAERFASAVKRLAAGQRCFADFASAHEYYGLHRDSAGWVFREHAPNANAAWLVGDFSDWKRAPQFQLSRVGGGGGEGGNNGGSGESGGDESGGDNTGTGDWELRVEESALCHAQHYHLEMEWRGNGGSGSGDGGDGESGGGGGWRIPAYARRVVQDPATNVFSAQVWNPPKPHVWQVEDFKSDDAARFPLIYEAHIGMAQEEERVGTYAEFRQKILPRIAKAGYNTLQLMAVMEHPYYGSFGYQVSNFFAPSSRFGTPEELKELVDDAHARGIAVIMDLVHSHAVLNENEGLARFDGTRHIYFHGGARGLHPVWDSALFDYGRVETLHLLLSNCRYWLDEFRFDGFRFDGVTSMLYAHHGLGVDFVDYSQYFGADVDEDAYAYLALANRVIHDARPGALTIAEDVSGMPGLGAPQERGGAGFDYRLAMGVTETWGKLARETRDEDWDLGLLWHELTTRRAEEKTIAYLESHDQALVGGKTFFFEMADKAVYDSMHRGSGSLVVERAVALHKIARLITLATASGGYLNFIGNEFGHPEWIDFPRAGNDWSYRFARRRWTLRDDPALLFKPLGDFDETLTNLFAARPRDLAGAPFLLRADPETKVLLFARGTLLIAANLHPAQSLSDYEIAVPPGAWTLLLDTDAPQFGGQGRIASCQSYNTATTLRGAEETTSIKVYLPARTAIVCSRVGASLK
jgi:1,4-alpha-glucan branching enzyme